MVKRGDKKVISKNKVKTSVIMAVYNGEKFIVKQMDSIRNQTQAPDEVIICDDCSTDNTREIVMEYINRYNLNGWILKFNGNNKGYYDNFFDGIKQANGQTIYLADQDDIWDLNKIKIFEDLYKSKPEIVMIQSNYVFIDSQDKKLQIEHSYHKITQKNGVVEISTKNMCNSPGSGFTMSFRKIVSSIIFQHEFEKNKWVFSFHDILLGLTSAALGKCVLCLDVVDQHRLHDTNVTKRIGQKYVATRSKSEQIIILKRRIKEFEIISLVCSDKSKKDLFYQFKLFNQYRYNLVEKRSFVYVPKLIKMRSYYASAFGVITDIMYAFGMDKFQMYLYKKINEMF